MNPFVLLMGGVILYVIGRYRGYKAKSFDGSAGRYVINGIVLMILGLAWLFK